MYKIKQLPEDFIVKEISNINSSENGQYAYYILKKMNYTTVDALQILSNKFKIPLKNFGFAGNKDKNAITEQKISIFRGSKNFENIKLNNIELKYLGNGKEPISLGDLKENEFTITIRNLSNKDIKKLKTLSNKAIKIPNLYGPQRFSNNNDLIGKAILKRDFKKTIELILENDGIVEHKIKDYMAKNKNNYIEALRFIPLKTRKLFVHSYQSFLFNKIVDEYLKNKNKVENIKIPIIGFNFEINSISQKSKIFGNLEIQKEFQSKNKQLKNIITKILDEENINSRDFIINQIPELTSEGGYRDLFFELKYYISEIEKDELNKNKQKIKINFTLPKSCYATIALEYFVN